MLSSEEAGQQKLTGVGCVTETLNLRPPKHVYIKLFVNIYFSCEFARLKKRVATHIQQVV